MYSASRVNAVFRMIKGIGRDIVTIPRMERLLHRDRFLEKVCTPYEQEYIKRHSVHTAAGLWAAKEAVGQALGTGFESLVCWHEGYRGSAQR